MLSACYYLNGSNWWGWGELPWRLSSHLFLEGWCKTAPLPQCKHQEDFKCFLEFWALMRNFPGNILTHSSIKFKVHVVWQNFHLWVVLYGGIWVPQILTCFAFNCWFLSCFFIPFYILSIILVFFRMSL